MSPNIGIMHCTGSNVFLDPPPPSIYNYDMNMFMYYIAMFLPANRVGTSCLSSLAMAQRSWIT